MAVPHMLMTLPLSSSVRWAGPVFRRYSSAAGAAGSRAQHVNNLAVLGLPATADREAVRRRYLELVKLHHPDTNCDPDAVGRFR
jgi:hypothetical protein